MGIMDSIKRKQPASTPSAASSEPTGKEDIYKAIIAQMAQQSPSRHFAAGSVFDIVRQNHNVFERIVKSNDVFLLSRFFANAYIVLCNNPASAGIFSTAIVQKSNNDTNPEQWNADIVNLSSGDKAALCYMPIQDDLLDGNFSIGVRFHQMQ